MELRHYIAGTLVEEPQGWGDFTEDLKRDYRLRLIGFQYPIDALFYGQAYEHLAGLYDADRCAVVPYRIEQQCENGWDVVVRAAVVLADIEWDLSRCQAKVKLVDDGIGARINNNKDVEVYPTGQVSKTGEDIDAPDPLDLEVFDPQASEPTYLASTRRAYDWLEVLQHCLRYIANANVSVVSAWYDALPDNERWCVIDGYTLRTGNTDKSQLKYTYAGLFTELAKKYNLWAAAERDTGGAPVLRIEPEEYFYGAQVVADFPHTDELIRTIDQDRLYASVKVGSSTSIRELGSTWSLPYLILRGFTEESYTLRCECNTDEELDLVNKWVIDSNVIEKCLGGSAEYDTDIFLIQYDAATSKAVKSDYLLDGGPYLYNEAALNVNVLNRYAFNCPLAVDVGDPEAEKFRAEFTLGPVQGFLLNWPGAATTVVDDPQFDDDYAGLNYDPDNAYGNGTVQGNPVAAVDNRYTAAFQGYYGFTMSLYLELVQNTIPTDHLLNVVPYFERYNSSNLFIERSPFIPGDGPTVTMQAEGEYSITGSWSFNLNPGDYVVPKINWGHVWVGNNFNPAVIEADILNRSFFRLDFNTLGGGDVVTTDPDAFYAVLYKFERHSTPASWAQLKADLSAGVRVGPSSVLYRGYPKEASRNIKTGATKWTLISNDRSDT